MKKQITVIFFIVFANLVIAQEKYFTFLIEGKYGITNAMSEEIIKPIYNYSTSIAAKDQIYLFGSKQDIIFNALTGEKQSYDNVNSNSVVIQNVPYSFIKNKGKNYLLSEENTKKIDLSENYVNFENTGKYIVAKYYPKSAPSKSSGLDKAGNPLPPTIEPVPETHLALLTNDESLKRVFKGDFKKFLPLYKVIEKKDDDIVSLKVIISDYKKKIAPNFNYIVFSKDNQHFLYNDKLLLIKKFVLADERQEQIAEACSKIANQKLSHYVQEDGFYPSVMAAPERTSSEGNDEKKPFKPFFFIKVLENGNTLLALQETAEKSKSIFEAKKDVKVYLDIDKNEIRFRIEGKNVSKCSFDPKTGNIYLPKAYFEEIGITVFQ